MAFSDKLAQILGTKNRDDQVAKVQQHMAPVVTLVIQADQRTGAIFVNHVGAPLSLEDYIQILTAAADRVRQEQLRQAAAEGAKKQPQPEQPQPDPAREAAGAE